MLLVSQSLKFIYVVACPFPMCHAMCRAMFHVTCSICHAICTILDCATRSPAHTPTRPFASGHPHSHEKSKSDFGHPRVRGSSRRLGERENAAGEWPASGRMGGMAVTLRRTSHCVRWHLNQTARITCAVNRWPVITRHSTLRGRDLQSGSPIP